MISISVREINHDINLVNFSYMESPINLQSKNQRKSKPKSWQFSRTLLNTIKQEQYDINFLHLYFNSEDLIQNPILPLINYHKS